jgi:predicted AlkP superfamily phosphohydrolase/phosphomutase
LAKFINWDKTLAYSGSSTEQGVYINVKGREPCGTVDHEAEYERIRKLIIHELYNLKDHETNKKIIGKVYKKEDLYKGPYLNEAPDIIFDMVDGYSAYNDLSNKPLFRKNTLNDNLISGSHRRNGILFVRGNNILRGKKIEQAEITDLLPTILFFMGLPIPKDLDGKILLDIFKDSFRDGNELSYCEPMNFDSYTNTYEDFDNESEEVKKRLKDLGYL